MASIEHLPNSENTSLGPRQRYGPVRAFSLALSAPLSPEDCCIQSMPDVSPTRWHLAHTTWFFETFLLKKIEGYKPFDERYEYLFNSYYNTIGQQFPRHRRGTISRPGLAEVLDYRHYVDDHLDQLLNREVDLDLDVLELGLQHEQQHQELMLTDIKHVLFCNPAYPSYHEDLQFPTEPKGTESGWHDFESSILRIGASESVDFAYDNEGPQHEQLVHGCQLATQCVTNGEFLQFIEADGYGRPEHWLSMGWSEVQDSKWTHPLYWIPTDAGWHEFTLSGLRPLQEDAPLCHISYFEADAYARWKGCRLPTEFEWERAANHIPISSDNLVFADLLQAHAQPFHPAQRGSSSLLGNIWEWTASPYTAYHGYTAPEGAIGEYNGKFMCNQFVLRGGSCATSSNHIRSSYRNFFPPEARWQFSGIRLARD